MTKAQASARAHHLDKSAEGAVLPVEHEYMTVAQVAALLQVKAPTVYTWVGKDASLPAIRICGTVRFRREALLRWLREREQGRPTPRKRLLSVAQS